MSWERTCQPKSVGGLGFRSLEDFNRALSAEQCWCVVKFPGNLASEVLKARYFPSCTFWEAR